MRPATRCCCLIRPHPLPVLVRVLYDTRLQIARDGRILHCKLVCTREMAHSPRISCSLPSPSNLALIEYLSGGLLYHEVIYFLLPDIDCTVLFRACNSTCCLRCMASLPSRPYRVVIALSKCLCHVKQLRDASHLVVLLLLTLVIVAARAPSCICRRRCRWLLRVVKMVVAG